MAEYYTNPKDVTPASLPAPRALADTGLAQSMAALGNTALKATSLFMESRRNNTLQGYNKGITDTGLNFLNELRAEGGEGPLSPEDVGTLTDVGNQISKIKLAERQKKAATGLRARLEAYHKTSKTNHPHLSIEMDQLFASATGMSIGQMMFQDAAMSEEEKILSLKDNVAQPDVSFNTKKAQAIAAIEVATQAGWNTDGMTNQQIIDKAMKEKGTAYQIAVDNQRIGHESNLLSYQTQEEQARRFFDPAYAADREVLGMAVREYDLLYPENRNVSTEEKRRVIGGLKRQELAAKRTDEELRIHQRNMELDPLYRARTVTNRAVEELYAKHSGVIDPDTVPYEDKFKFVMEGFQPEWQSRVSELQRKVQESYPEGALQLKVEDEAITRYARDFGMADPGITKDMIMNHHKFQSGVEAHARNLQMMATTATLTQEAEGAVRGRILTEATIPSLQVKLSTILKNYVAEREGGGFTPEESKQIKTFAAQQLEEIKGKILSDPGANSRRELVNAQLKVFDDMANTMVEVGSNKMQAEEAKALLDFYRHTADRIFDMSRVNANDPNAIPMTAYQFEQVMRTARGYTNAIANSSFGTDIEDKMGVLVNTLMPSETGYLGDAENAQTSQTSVLNAYSTMANVVLNTLADPTNPNTDEVVSNALRRFIFNDYTALTKNGDIPDHQLQVLGQASITFLSNEKLEDYMSKHPEQRQVLESTVRQFTDRTLAAQREVMADELDKAFIHTGLFGTFKQRQADNLHRFIEVPKNSKYFMFSAKHKNADSFKRAVREDFPNMDDQEANRLYTKVQAAASNLNQRFAPSIQSMAQLRANYHNIELQQAVQDIYNGISIFDTPVEEPSKTQ